MRVASLDLQLDWRLEVKGNELSFDLTKVLEHGSFRLETLEFPDHYLVRVPATGGKGEAIAANTVGKNGKIHSLIFFGSRLRIL